jgi:CotH kinase protein
VPFVDSNLPLVAVHTGGEPIADYPKIPATMWVISDPDGDRSNLQTTPAAFAGRVGIELRGQTSMGYPKKQYGFETRDPSDHDLEVSLLGMPEDEDWILQGPWRDKTMFRNAFAYELSNQIGRYAVRTRFVEAFVDEVSTQPADPSDVPPDMADFYVGIFVIMEKIKRGDDRVNVQPNVESDVSGGWILKIDKESKEDTDPPSPEPSFTTSHGTKILYHYPDRMSLSDAQERWIRGYFDRFESALETGKEDYNAYIDSGSFVDYFIVNELMKNIDAYRISTYMHKDRGSRLKMGPVWDFDLSSMNVGRYGGDRPDGWVILEDFSDPNEKYKPPFWWKKILGDEDFFDQLVARWGDLREGALGRSNVFTLIDSWATLLEEAQVRNYERWPDGLDQQGSEPVAYPTYAGEVKEFKDFLDARLDWIDAELAQDVPREWLRPVLHVMMA